MKKLSIFIVLCWLVVIFLLSSEPSIKSVARSGEIKEKSVSVFNDLTNNIVDKNDVKKVIHNYLHIDTTFIIRKSAHFIEFFILGILVLNVLIHFCKFNKKIIFISLLLCFLYACSDEFHQLFVTGRTGRFPDVLIDTSGSFIGIISFYFTYWLLKIKPNLTILNNNIKEKLNN